MMAVTISASAAIFIHPFGRHRPGVREVVLLENGSFSFVMLFL